MELPKRVAIFFYLLVFVFLYLPLTQDYVICRRFSQDALAVGVHGRDRTAVNPQINDISCRSCRCRTRARELKSLAPPL